MLCSVCFFSSSPNFVLFLGNRGWWQQESHHHLRSRSSAEVLPEDSGASGEGAGEEVQRKARGLHCTGEDDDVCLCSTPFDEYCRVMGGTCPVHMCLLDYLRADLPEGAPWGLQGGNIGCRGLCSLYNWR